ncbi:MAG: sensor histidine kinase, partial [Ferrovibrionaceae bacterium]
TPESELSGRPFAEALPEMAELFAQVAQSGLRQSHGQVVLVREGRATTLMVRVAREGAFAESLGYVVTFDDITDLVLAQRTAAWAELARRIAPEIKNPLPPIQLAAERLKRKYLKEVTSDPDVFIKCTETIVRQVGDIGRMVDEFSSFARMPAPQFAREDVVELVRQAVFLQAQAHGDIAYPVEAPDHLHILCDGRQLSQVLTNLYQNAADAIEGRNGEDLPRGNIATAVTIAAEGDLVLTVTDNGRGLPVENRERLVEPYVTTRAKGTGLGLAIVRKVMEEHGGELRLADAPGGGARITLRFPAASLMSDNQDTSEAGQEPARATTGV